MKEKVKSGHKEIISETIVKLELFKNRINAYSRFLDMDRIDFITRTKKGDKIIYNEIQVKYSRLYLEGMPHSWKPLKEKELDRMEDNFFYIFVIGGEELRNEDYLFIIPSKDVHKIKEEIKVINRENGEKEYAFNIWEYGENKWGLKRRDDKGYVDITNYLNAFDLLK